MSNILGSFHGENFLKLGLDTSLKLCYISNKFLHGLFCKNVHIFVKQKSGLLADFGLTAVCHLPCHGDATNAVAWLLRAGRSRVYCDAPLL